MPQVEDMPGPPGCRVQHLVYPRVQHHLWCEQRNRIQIPLHRDRMVQAAPGLVERYSPCLLYTSRCV